MVARVVADGELELLKLAAVDALRKSMRERDFVSAIIWKEELDRIEYELMKQRRRRINKRILS